MSDKIFIEGTHIKEKEFEKNGERWSKMSMSFELEKFYQDAKQHMNEKGYVNTTISKRKVPSEYGHTHFMELDTWKPTNQQTVTHNDMGGIETPKEDLGFSEIPF